MYSCFNTRVIETPQVLHYLVHLCLRVFFRGLDKVTAVFFTTV